jgi:thimet oligopeptidase
LRVRAALTYLVGPLPKDLHPMLFRAATSPAIVAVTGLLLGACAPEPPPDDDRAAAAGNPAVTSPTVSDESIAFSRRCESDAIRAREMLAALEAYDGPATVAGVLEPYNELLVAIFDASQGAGLMHSVHPDAAVRRAAGECEQIFDAIEVESRLSRPLYELVAAVDVADADPKTRYFVERTLRDFRLQGVDKNEATRARIRALNEEITALGQTFDRNITNSVGSIEVPSVDGLAGMPADWIEARDPDENGRYRVTTRYPDFIPFMRYAHNDELRRALYVERQNRGYPENVAVLEALIEKRWEVARLQGFESWADQALADKMIGDAEQAALFIDSGSTDALPRAREDYAELLAQLRKEQPEATVVQPWQQARLAHLVREEKFGLDPGAVRSYFEYGQVRDGIFRLTSDLFGVSFRKREGAETWHEDVEAWEMVEDGQVIGRFYLDMHPRDGKYQHAAHFYYRAGLADGRIPESVLVCNFPGGDGRPARMEQEQVETFLHEFGHLLHYLFRYRQPWLGISQPERDFIEAPSTMLEEWVYDAPTLQSFARNEQGEPIPDELVAKMRAARDFGQGLFVHRQLFLAALSLNFYDRDPDSFELEGLYRELSDRYSLLPYVEGTHMYTAFGHLNSYSAYYYTYMWSLAIAYDMFGRFEAAGLRDRSTAMDYREKVLAVGGSKPAREFIDDFLGRPYDFTAFERRLDSGTRGGAR